MAVKKVKKLTLRQLLIQGGRKPPEPEVEDRKPKVSLFDFLTDISHGKKWIMTPENEKEYVPFIVNRFISAEPDAVFFASDMNLYHWLPKRIQYAYLMHSIRSRKRYFQKWDKREVNADIQLLSDYYNISYDKARDILPLHRKKDLEKIERSMFTGGKA